MTFDGDKESAEIERWKGSMNLVSFEDIGQLEYPLIASAYLDYYGTGHGRTMGQLVMWASTEEHLRWAIVQAWGDYLSKVVHVRPWAGPLPEFELLMTPALSKILSEYRDELPMFSVASTLHFNLT